jgi:uncharacterized protein YkwD
MAFKVPGIPVLIASLALIALACAPVAAGQMIHQQRLVAVDSEAESGPLIAPPDVCPQQERIRGPADVQEQAMLCLVDFARRAAGLSSALAVESLMTSADLKSRDILACDEFDHYACGRNFSHWIHASGYTAVPCWRVGETIAYGRGVHGSPRAMFIAWMRSPSHRGVILGEFSQIGAAVRYGELGFYGRVRVWTQHFGDQRCDEAPE